MRILSLCTVALLVSACTAEVEVETKPVTQVIPAVSIGVPIYAEVAFDIPKEARGDVVVLDAQVDTDVVNTSTGNTFALSAWVSSRGTATPRSPYVFTPTERPPYLDEASELVRDVEFDPGETRHLTVRSPNLDLALRNERVWFIFRTDVRSNSLLPGAELFDVRLEDIIFRATATRSFDELTGVQEIGGL